MSKIMESKSTVNDTMTRTAFLSAATYNEVKQEVDRKVKKSGTTVSKYLEALVLEDLRRDGVTITVKAEKKLI